MGSQYIFKAGDMAKVEQRLLVIIVHSTHVSGNTFLGFLVLFNTSSKGD